MSGPLRRDAMTNPRGIPMGVAESTIEKHLNRLSSLKKTMSCGLLIGLFTFLFGVGED